MISRTYVHGETSDTYLRPDLIFMDTQHPGENGLDVIKEIKRVYNKIVIVILTSNDLPENDLQAIRS